MAAQQIPVEGHSHLARDRHTGAVVNINISEAAAARKRKADRQRRRDEQDQLKRDVGGLKQDVADIKEMLSEFLRNNNGQ